MLTRIWCAKSAHQETCLKIYLSDDEAGAKQYAALRTSLENLKARDEEHAWGRLVTETALTRQEDWEWGWKQYFKPFPVGHSFMIKPSWETVDDAQGRRILEIDPASSFGTGSHDTTQLCMCALEDNVKPGDTVLDMGTGSGILAIAAAMLGAEVRTVVDIDETACARRRRTRKEPRQHRPRPVRRRAARRKARRGHRQRLQRYRCEHRGGRHHRHGADVFRENRRGRHAHLLGHPERTSGRGSCGARKGRLRGRKSREKRRLERVHREKMIFGMIC